VLIIIIQSEMSRFGCDIRCVSVPLRSFYHIILNRFAYFAQQGSSAGNRPYGTDPDVIADRVPDSVRDSEHSPPEGPESAHGDPSEMRHGSDINNGPHGNADGPHDGDDKPEGGDGAEKEAAEARRRKFEPRNAESSTGSSTGSSGGDLLRSDSNEMKPSETHSTPENNPEDDSQKPEEKKNSSHKFGAEDTHKFDDTQVNQNSGAMNTFSGLGNEGGPKFSTKVY
jgi:hypothetical protein